MEDLGINLSFLLFQLLVLLVMVTAVAAIVLLIVGLLRWRRPTGGVMEGSTLLQTADVTPDGLLLPPSLLKNIQKVEIRRQEDMLLIVPIHEN